MKLRPSKCELFQHEIDFLGYHLSGEGVHTQEKKIRAIAKISVPTTAKLALSFVCLCLAGYYRKFIKNFAETSRPIHNAVHATKWNWTDECQKAFDTLKEALTNPPILAHPNFNETFYLECDASQYQIGLILSQLDDMGRQRVVSYASRLLTASQQKYSATERECLAMVEGIRHYRSYLYGKKFKVYTDHSALVWLHNHKDHRSKLMRWFTELQDYDYEVIHRPGKLSENVDALSRLPHDDDPTEQPDDTPTTAALTTEDTPELIDDTEEDDDGIAEGRDEISHEVHTTNITDQLDELRKAQRRDPAYARIIQYKLNGDLPLNQVAATRVVAEASQMEMDQGILYHIWYPQDRRLKEEIRRRIALPTDRRSKALYECHDNNLTGGHLGFHKTYDKLRERYHFPNMYSKTREYVETCIECAKRKGAQPIMAGVMKPIVAKEAFDIVGMDFFGPLPTTKQGNTQVLSFTDHFTKYVSLHAVKRGLEDKVAQHLTEGIICNHGVMNRLISDRGQSFISKVITEVYKVFKIKKISTTAWHPQANGQTEKFNLVMRNMLSAYVEEHQTTWDTLLPYIAFAYNAATHDTTKFSPFQLLYGRQPRFPYELALGTATYTGTGIGMQETTLASDIESRFRKILQIARDNTEMSQHKMTLYADKKKTAVTYRVGDKVWLYTPQKSTKHIDEDGSKYRLAKKLKHPWQGPYEVIKQISPNVVKLRHDKGQKVHQNVHVCRLKIYKERILDEVPTLTEDDKFDPSTEKIIDNSNLEEGEESPEEESIVDKISRHRITPLGKVEYWTHYSNGEESWQPEDNFTGEDGEVTEALLKYFDSKRKPTRLELYIQLLKYDKQFKAPKYPFNTAIRILTDLLGPDSTHLKHGPTKSAFKTAIKSLKSMDGVSKFTDDLLSAWEHNMKDEKKYRDKEIANQNTVQCFEEVNTITEDIAVWTLHNLKNGADLQMYPNMEDMEVTIEEIYIPCNSPTIDISESVKLVNQDLTEINLEEQENLRKIEDQQEATYHAAASTHGTSESALQCSQPHFSEPEKVEPENYGSYRKIENETAITMHPISSRTDHVEGSYGRYELHKFLNPKSEGARIFENIGAQTARNGRKPDQIKS